MNVWCFLLAVFCRLIVQVDGGVTVVDGSDPGSCDKSNHADELLVKDHEGKDKKIICTEKDGVYQWTAIDGSNTPGEFFNPGYDCSNILDKDIDAKDGFYWIKLSGQDPKKVWCDMTTDGGGFMLIGRKNNSVTLSVPSNDDTVEPFGSPHWSSALGDAPIVDFRIQMASSEDFKDTKAHWSFRLQTERALKNLLMTNQGGCSQFTAGIGNIAYVKDLQTETIVNTHLRCSNFGLGHHPSLGNGWTAMNSCLQKPCSLGFGFHPIHKHKTDVYGGFSYSATGNSSGIIDDATAFVGCDYNLCCGCYGPVGGTQHYCTRKCQALNGGTVIKHVYTWFWVRSSLPKRLWKKCMEYKILDSNGKPVWFNILAESAVPKEGRCNTNEALLHDGIVVVPDASAAKKIPPVPGLLAFRNDNKELYVRANKTWNEIAQKKEVLQEAAELSKPNLEKINNLQSEAVQANQKINKVENQVKNINDSIDYSRMTMNKKLSQLENQIGQYNYSRIAMDKKLSQLEKNMGQLFAPSVPECTGYSWLKDANRNVNHNSGTVLCDSGLSSGWYRFGGGAGTRMPTSCVPKSRCATHGSGWMNGKHPSIWDGKVTRTVCYHWYSNCCNWSNNIEVRNCGSFYVYKLKPPTAGCYLRYCAS